MLMSADAIGHSRTEKTSCGAHVSAFSSSITHNLPSQIRIAINFTFSSKKLLV
jgi:hypothetical protein